jgi:hypothetical protein
MNGTSIFTVPAYNNPLDYEENFEDDHDDPLENVYWKAFFIAMFMLAFIISFIGMTWIHCSFDFLTIAYNLNIFTQRKFITFVCHLE